MGRGSLRIAMVIGQFSPVVGGAEVQAGRLASELIRRGQDARILTGRWSHAWPAEEEIEGAPVKRIGALRPWLGLPGLRRHSYRWFVRGLRRELIALGRQVDIVHAHQILEPAVAAVRASRVTGVPVIAKMSGSGMAGDLDGLRRRSGEPAWRELCAGLARFVAVSESAAAAAVAAGFPSERVRRIPNGAPAALWRKESYDGSRRLVCVARCRPVKGLDVLIRAFGRLAAERGELALDLVGGGPERKALEALARGLGLSERVTFHGDVPDPTPFLRQADVFVLPSRAEGFSNALLEAMAAGLPCVATAVGGATEVITHGDTGLLVRPEDPAALEDAVGRALDDAGLRERMGRRARRRVEEDYSIASVADRYEALYREVIADRMALRT